MHHLIYLILLASAVRAHVPDGIHRIDKKPQTTRPSRLHPRDASNVCGTDMKLCPSSLGGNCCPRNYQCGSESCYATTKGPSTCGSRVGWYACGAVYGGGCCPDGYLCQRAANCVPPSGSPYSFDCPASQYLCPSSMSYGCCPNGMGCAVDQCYSTSTAPVTSTMVITTTDQGRVSEVTKTTTIMASPASPTALLEVDSDLGSQSQKVLKYYPAAVSKVPAAQIDGDSSSSISPAQLGGIVAGCVSLSVLLLLVIFVLWRRYWRDEAESDRGSRQPEMTAKSEFDDDTTNVDAAARAPSTPRNQRSPVDREPPSVHDSTELALTERTPVSPTGGSVFRHAGYSPAAYSEARGAPTPSVSLATPESSPGGTPGGHMRALSDLSDISGSIDVNVMRHRAPPAELQGQPCIAELPSAPSLMASATMDDWARLDARVSAWQTHHHLPPPAYSQHYMSRINGWASNVAASRLHVVDEEKQASL